MLLFPHLVEFIIKQEGLLIMTLSKYIGDTPLLKLSEKLYAKLEYCNPSGSIKDRLVSYILDRAEEFSLIKQGDTIIESTSGNTGIALAMLGAERGYNIVVVIPKNMSKEKTDDKNAGS